MEKINLGQYEFLGAEVLAHQKNKRHWKGQKRRRRCGQLEAHF